MGSRFNAAGKLTGHLPVFRSNKDITAQVWSLEIFLAMRGYLRPERRKDSWNSRSLTSGMSAQTQLGWAGSIPSALSRE